jgi:1-acyl-sn-glycerol-3-phosphate acyltransferase
LAGSLVLSLRNAAETLAISVPTVFDAARGRLTKQTCDDRLESWAARVVEHLDMAIEVRGRENFSPKATYLVMSNHQSHYDIPVLFHVLGPPHGQSLRMIAKIELFSLPFFGRAMREAGFIAIDRQSREAAIESLAVAKERMRQGVNVWIAPEGTRSPTGQLLPFKKGGFHLALEVGEPVLPVTVQGTRSALPRGASRSSRGASVRVTIHPAIDVSAYDDTPEGVAALSEDVRATIASVL